MAGVDTTYRRRSERPSCRAEERPRPLGRTKRKRKCRDGQAERNWKKKSCGVTTPRSSPGTRISEKYLGKAKARNLLEKACETRRIAPRVPIQNLLAEQVARCRPRDLAELWGQRPPPRAKRPATMQHAGPPAASGKSGPPPRPPRAARKAILGR